MPQNNLSGIFCGCRPAVEQLPQGVLVLPLGGGSCAEVVVDWCTELVNAAG
jgi:hypothetical protein